MSRSLRRLSLALAVAAAVGAFDPATMAAQEPSRADMLDQQARELQKDVRTWSRSASKHRASAELRTLEDPRGYQSLVMAAFLYYYSGHGLKALRAFEAAAPLALENGDVKTAARAYVEAASIAREQRDMVRYRANAWRAGRLAQSPALTEAQRNGILERLGTGAQVAVRP